MAVVDLVLPSNPPLSERNRRLVIGTSLTWLASLVIFSLASWIDNGVLSGRGHPYLPYFLGWARGMAPWLVLLPIVFRFGTRYENEDLPSTLISACFAGLVCMIIVGSWAAFAFSIGTDRSPFDVLANFRLMDWMWDIVFYVLAFLAGRQMRPRQPVIERVNPEPADIAVKSHDKVEYVPVREILGATAQGNYIALHLEKRDVLHRATMASLAAVLADAGFVRTHRSHMVNPVKVVTTQARGGRVKGVTLPNGVTLPVSERYNDDVLSRLSERVCA